MAAAALDHCQKLLDAVLFQRAFVILALLLCKSHLLIDLLHLISQYYNIVVRGLAALLGFTDGPCHDRMPAAGCHGQPADSASML